MLWHERDFAVENSNALKQTVTVMKGPVGRCENWLVVINDVSVEVDRHDSYFAAQRCSQRFVYEIMPEQKVENTVLIALFI